ncbi:hypothetical protein FIBSPDRAFT_960809 [Athelia psychrophila]|uniref:Uncharacterized protein n=1 Tax=Athelia psychrophila TaxID=1759441 RepID=A0A166BZN0_9AGAM|nr:hypothetical protein FIBSPDRAFT_960809 [Fibularhizoctonia sp. CBS 109695]
MNVELTSEYRHITIAAVKYLVFKKLKTPRHLDDEMLPQLRALMLGMLERRPGSVADIGLASKKDIPGAALRTGDGPLFILTGLDLWAFRLAGIALKMKPSRRFGNWSLERAGRV